MKKKIKKQIIDITKFAIILIITIILVNLLFQKTILDNSLLGQEEKDLKKYGEQTKIFIMGDSHAKTALNPATIQNSFNFASNGENMLETYSKIKYLLEKDNYNFDTIIIPLDLHSLSSYKTARFENEEWYWKKYVNFKEAQKTNPEIDATKRELFAKIPILGRGDWILTALISGKTQTAKGHIEYVNNFSNNQNKEKEVEKRTRTQFNQQQTIDPINMNYLKEIMKLTEQQNKKIIFIKYPVTSEYLESAKQYFDREEYYNTIQKDLTEYTNYEILDYQEIYKDQPELFSDPDHLNTAGSKKFSQQIWQDINK